MVIASLWTLRFDDFLADIERALRIAKSGRPGAAYVEIPVRILRCGAFVADTSPQADFFAAEIPVLLRHPSMATYLPYVPHFRHQ